AATRSCSSPAPQPSGPGLATLILAGAAHKRSEDDVDGSPGGLTLKVLQGAVVGSPKQQGEKTLPHITAPSFPVSPRTQKQREGDGWGCDERLPAVAAPRHRDDVVSAKLAGVPQLHVAVPLRRVVPLIGNPREEALWSLSALVSAFRNQADYGEMLASFYRGSAPAHCSVLADWLSSMPQNPFVWSRMHHRVRCRSRRRHLSMIGFAEARTPGALQVRRLLTYVKGWMAELDDQ
ncbi:unnamed protein product, partial [Polarella glacialis]